MQHLIFILLMQYNIRASTTHVHDEYMRWQYIYISYKYTLNSLQTESDFDFRFIRENVTSR